MIDKQQQPPVRPSFKAFRPDPASKIHIATPEDTDTFQAHCAAYIAELAPVGAIERDLVQLIAEGRWRLKRAHCIEHSLLARGISQHVDEWDTGRFEVDDALAEGQTWIDLSRCLTALTQYEQRVQRSIKENTAALNARQIERKQAYQHAQKEAVTIPRPISPTPPNAAASSSKPSNSCSPPRFCPKFAPKPHKFDEMTPQNRTPPQVSHPNHARTIGVRPVARAKRRGPIPGARPTERSEASPTPNPRPPTPAREARPIDTPVFNPV